MKIAIIGAGISGLTAAHLLHQKHDLTVFEANPYAGGHTNTIRVDTADATHEVDTGFIVFNDKTYPNFERMLDRIGVGWQPSTMTFGVSDDAGDFEYNGASVNGLYAKREHLVTPWFHRMVTDLVRFNRRARELLLSDEHPTLGDWLDSLRLSRPFIDKLIVPQAAAVWSSDPRQMWTFPARFLVQFFENHGMLGLRGRPQWRTVEGGSKTYVTALTEPFRDRLRLDTPIDRIRRSEDNVTVIPRTGEPETFDEVILATHSDQSLRMLDDATDREHELLGAIPYQANEAVLHTDVNLLPRRRRAWASWNYHLPEEPVGKPTVTYHMNRLQSLTADREFCVTLNRTERIDPEKIIRTIHYAHPVYTNEGHRAQGRFDEISGRNRTHFAGAYWHWGFHEDGVVSGIRAAEQVGARS